MKKTEIPINLNDGWKALQNELNNSTTPIKPSTNGELKLKQITTAAAVFQPRSFGTDSVQKSRSHIESLKAAILASKDKSLEPIIVWWSGKCYRVIDGHHRLEAYRELKEAKKLKRDAVPVIIFEGSIEQALSKSVAFNSRDKLQMTKEDKLQSAWKLVCLEAGNKTLISQITTISTRTIATMRARRDLFIKEHGDNGKEEILKYSWEDIKAQRDPVDITEDYEEAEARKWAKELAKTFGDRPRKQPIRFARAIEIYSEPLANSLGHWWNDTDPEF